LPGFVDADRDDGRVDVKARDSELGGIVVDAGMRVRANGHVGDWVRAALAVRMG
jgi:hypothetical protein